MKRPIAPLLIALASPWLFGGAGGAGEPSAASELPVCLQGEPFIADGSFPLATNQNGDAHELSKLRWSAHQGCERFVIDLAAADGGPADSVGEVRVEVLRELGVVRVTLRDVEWVDPEATEASFDGPLAHAAYSVWAPEGRWVYVDLHVTSEAEAYVSVLEKPARVLVDLRPGGGDVPPPATAANLVVVLEPRPGEATYPLTVTGYARTFEANVVVRLEQQGEDILEAFTTATAWADAWGHYSLTIEDGPLGPVALHVGDYAARDGSWQGVSIELHMRDEP